jgi:Tol biopolymer transport system component
MPVRSHLARTVTVLAAAVCLTGALAATSVAATTPGANGRIAFYSDRGGSWSLYAMGADGSDPVEIVPGAPDNEGGPSWSSDGLRVVYQLGCQICTANADGSAPTCFGDLLSCPFEVDVSPDGTQIVYRGMPDADLFVVDADGTDDVRLTDDGMVSDDKHPVWSPDGSRIAFVSNLGGGSAPYDLWTIGPDGSDPFNVTQGQHGLVERPSWSPDGTMLAFSEGQVNGITVIGADGTDPRAVTSEPTDIAPAWSPDGTLLAFHSTRDDPEGDIYTVALDGSNLTRIAAAGADRDPSWQPSCIFGTDGADALTGTPGSDCIFGGAANDTLTGGGGNDLLVGELGSDRLAPGKGLDLVWGGEGQDTVSYADAGSKVRVDLAAGSTAGAGADLLESIANVIGSAFADVLAGDAGANRLEGGKGADSLSGLAGNDVLEGGKGDDDLRGGKGTDVCRQGPGAGVRTGCEG